MTVNLPSGQACHVDDGHVRVENISLNYADTAALCRIFLTTKPLVENDVRLGLINEVRASVVKSEAGRNWIVLNVVKLFQRQTA